VRVPLDIPDEAPVDDLSARGSRPRGLTSIAVLNTDIPIEGGRAILHLLGGEDGTRDCVFNDDVQSDFLGLLAVDMKLPDKNRVMLGQGQLWHCFSGSMLGFIRT
jgi:hypothetical protein